MTLLMESQMSHTGLMRIFRAAILNGVEPPADVVARLQSQGVDVGEIEARIRQQIEWRH